MQKRGIRVKEEYREAILKDEELRAHIAKKCNKSGNTVYRWCKDNSEMLTMLPALDAIKDYMKVKDIRNITQLVPIQKQQAA